jgi:hypothetical protein
VQGTEFKPQFCKKRNEVMIHAITQMNLENIIPTEISQLQKNTVVFHLYEMSRIGKSIQTEWRLVIAWGRGEWRVTVNKCRFSFLE